MKNKENSHVYLLSQEEVLKKFQTRVQGLTEQEALKRLEKYGANKIKKKQDLHWLGILGNQFNNALVWILLVAALLAFLFGQHRDMTIVLLIVFFNAAIGFFQEYKAERTLQKIKSLAADSALVIRNKEKREINSEELVPGDVVGITSGDNIPADGYLLESYDLYVNDFIFTGESNPNQKDTVRIVRNSLSLGEVTNMVFMGSMVTRGEGVFVVTGTGMQTELGKIAGMVTEIHADQTPLQRKLELLSRQVSILAVLIGLVVLVVGRYYGLSWMETFLFALALAVSVVPEGLPAAISVALSLGMRRLLKDSVLAKKLTAVEALGSVSVVCTDKTGTLTRNELMVTKIILAADQEIQVDGEGYVPKGNFYFQNKKINFKTKQPVNLSSLPTIFKIGVLCNDADLTRQDGNYKIIGDPTEGAIIVAARKYNPQISKTFGGEKKINQIPFSSERMMMSVIYKNKENHSYVKGSPDVLIERASHILENDKIRKITAADKRKIKAKYNAMSAQALRVLAFALRNLENLPSKKYLEEAEKGLVWVGMMGMIDPPRKEVSAAIHKCNEAGIKVMMITGDYEITAKAIAEQVGLINIKKQKGAIKNKGKILNKLRVTNMGILGKTFQQRAALYADENVINGKTLDQLTDKQLMEMIKDKNVVFARINPNQKLRIATVLKENGKIIAMTGDGVNDALALKKADIGVAMGRIGTDVAKEASDMILMNDNFVSIAKAIGEGRTIYQNVKKFVHYVFTSNASELFTVVIGVLLGLPAPLTAIQILATDLGTDLFPSLALGVDPAPKDIMKQPPYNPQEKVVNGRGFLRIIYIGVSMAICAVAAFLWSMLRGGWVWGQEIDFSSDLYLKSTTVTYAVISMTQMANLLHSRSEEFSPFQIGFFKNRYAIGSIFVSLGMLLSFIYLPFFQQYLHTQPISKADWISVAISVVVVYLLEEARKLVLRKSAATKANAAN